MNNTITFDLTEEQAAQLGELIDECLQEMSATDEIMNRRWEEIARLRAETDVHLARLKEQAKKGLDNVEAILQSRPTSPVVG